MPYRPAANLPTIRSSGRISMWMCSRMCTVARAQRRGRLMPLVRCMDSVKYRARSTFRYGRDSSMQRIMRTSRSGRV